MNKNGYIALIGLPGCGKSTIARMLAKRLHLPCIDLDKKIASMAGASIPELFAQSETLFRNWETRALASVPISRAVLACGGGIVKRAENMQLLSRGGICVYIDRPVELIAKSIDTSTRPLLSDNRTKIYALQRERELLYREAADITILNDTSPDETVEKIFHALNELEERK